MSSEDDVPLGEEAGRYYDRQFRDRIRQVRKSGAPSRDSGGASNWSGRAGIGAVGVVVYIIIRVVIAVSRDHSTPQYSYSPPQPIPFDAEMQKQLNDLAIGGGQKDALEPNGLFGPQSNPLLVADDVPLLEGLCYRIHQESLRRERTPGGQICQLLDPDAAARKLLVKAANGQELDLREPDQLRDALNQVLRRGDFYEPAPFRNVPGVAPLILGDREGAWRDLLKFNRSVLEKCYPEQIVPLRERDNLNDQTRQQWQKRAKADLEKAKWEFAQP